MIVRVGTQRHNFIHLHKTIKLKLYCLLKVTSHLITVSKKNIQKGYVSIRIIGNLILRD